jgi:methyltransferase-like protein/2-polyprenyl-3-methyl-5-hydroxy-6-metoxy-1,4-benzoquinol methylase
MANPEALTGYDRVPYPPLTYVHAHPNRMATTAILLGLTPAPVGRCRVLELGCAGGGNLIPAAYELPESRFVGIDLSKGHIDEGRSAAAALGLGNITFKHMSITDIDSGLGQFDYIIVHGVFSWVSREVQDKILEVCRENLARNGVAFVSYNTYPGWHLRSAMRDAMLYHARKCAGDPKEACRQARSMLEFMTGSLSPENTSSPGLFSAYAYLLRATRADIRSKEDAVLLNDELGEVNEPFYFHEFAERAARHGMQYLFEADFPMHLYGRLPEETRRALGEAASDIIEVEQYIDFLTNRCFRRTLLCREGISLDRTLRPERVGRFLVASRARPLSERPDVTGTSSEEFRSPDGACLRSDGPFTKAAMLYLGEQWPRAVPFKDLITAASSMLEVEPESERELAGHASSLGLNLLKGFSCSADLVDFYVEAPAFVPEAGERPVASPVARFQAMRGAQVSNLRHERLELEPSQRRLLCLLDGTHDRAALLDEMCRSAEKNSPDGEGKGESIKEGSIPRGAAKQALDLHLHGFAQGALLVG